MESEKCDFFASILAPVPIFLFLYEKNLLFFEDRFGPSKKKEEEKMEKIDKDQTILCIDMLVKSYTNLNPISKHFLNLLVLECAFSKDLEKNHYEIFNNRSCSSFEGAIIQIFPKINTDKKRQEFYDPKTQKLNFCPLELGNNCMAIFVHELIHCYDDLYLNVSENIIIPFMLKNRIFAHLIKPISSLFHYDFTTEYPPGFFIDSINECSKNQNFNIILGKKEKDEKILEKIDILRKKKMFRKTSPPRG